MTDRSAFAQHLIEKLHLEPLPGEGGLYVLSYRSSEEIPLNSLAKRYPGRRRFCSAIYYLLTDEADSFSAMHALLTDEIYHFYLGDPVEMLLLYPDGHTQRTVLGQDILKDQQVQMVVPHGVWQGSRLRPGGKFALLGTTMAPGYEQDELKLGRRDDLMRQYPAEADWIRRLTRG